MAQEKVSILIALQDKASQGIKSVKNSASKLGLALDKTRSKIVKLAAKVSTLKIPLLAVSAAVGATSVAFLKAAGKMEDYQIQFETMTKSAQKGQKVLKEVTDFAANTPFELPGLIESSKQLLAFGVDTENIIPTLTSLGDIAAGVGTEKLPTIVRAFGKIQVKGKASMEELNMLLEAGVPILDELAKGYDVSTAKVLEMSSKGQIGFKDVEDALKRLSSETGMFGGMMGRLSTTLNGQFSNLKDNIFQVSSEIGKSLLPMAKNIITAFNNALGSITPEKIEIFFAHTQAIAEKWSVTVTKLITAPFRPSTYTALFVEMSDSMLDAFTAIEKGALNLFNKRKDLIEKEKVEQLSLSEEYIKIEEKLAKDIQEIRSRNKRKPENIEDIITTTQKNNIENNIENNTDNNIDNNVNNNTNNNTNNNLSNNTDNNVNNNLNNNTTNNTENRISNRTETIEDITQNVDKAKQSISELDQLRDEANTRAIEREINYWQHVKETSSKTSAELIAIDNRVGELRDKQADEKIKRATSDKERLFEFEEEKTQRQIEALYEVLETTELTATKRMEIEGQILRLQEKNTTRMIANINQLAKTYTEEVADRIVEGNFNMEESFESLKKKILKDLIEGALIKAVSKLMEVLNLGNKVANTSFSADYGGAPKRAGMPGRYSFETGGIATHTGAERFAKSEKVQKFATGGIVGGSSYTGDKVPIRVNSGEAILNTNQQGNIIDSVNNLADFFNSGKFSNLVSSSIANSLQNINQGEQTPIDYNKLGQAVASAISANPPQINIDGQELSENLIVYHDQTYAAYEGGRI